MNIDIIHELSGYGIEHTVKDGFAEVICPFHTDSTPSGSVSLEHGGFKCFACSETSQFVQFLAASVKKEPNLIRIDLESRYGSSNDKVIDVNVVERYHKALATEKYLTGELAKRAIDPEVSKQRRLGACNGRITIPVYNKAGYVVNIRKHRPGGFEGKKVLNQRGHGKPLRLYPIEQLKYDKIVLCGGELKAIAAAHVLNKVGIGAICATAGEGNWDVTLSSEFKDKTVYIAYDIDEAGIKGAEKVAAFIYPISRELFILRLPLDIDQFPTGDVNDFLAGGGDLPGLLDTVEGPWTPPHRRHTLNGDTTKVHISSVVNAEHTSKRVSSECVVSAIGQQPYSVPRNVVCRCTRSQDVCSACPVFFEQGDVEFELHPEDPMLLGMIETSDQKREEAIKMAMEIPLRCSASSFETVDYYHVEDVRLSPMLEISSREVQREMIPAFMMEQNIVLNETYKVAGRPHPHPKTQASTLLISDGKISEDALTQYKNNNPHELNLFKPKEWTVESLRAKLKELYADFASNVTNIYNRNHLHLAIDLAFHSVLFFEFKGRKTKGWADILVMGDTGQGKTHTTTELMRHYKLGEKIDCKNATVAGILGGLQQMGTKWFVSWGVIPTHDRRLVVLEELKGMHQETFSKLTDMRSSGQAELPKIEKRKTHARTRLISLTNPPGGRDMGSYPQGVKAIKDLIKAPEDIRRFDMAVIVASKDHSQQQVEKLAKQLDSIDHFYTSDLCHRLVLWAWTVDKVKFEDESHLMEQASTLREKFSDGIPLLDKGSTHLKLARLSAALAARTYSTDGDDYDTLIVRKCHVEYIAGYLNHMYSMPTFKYDVFSESRRDQEIIKDTDGVKSIINQFPDARGAVRYLQNRSTVDVADIQHCTRRSREDCEHILSNLVMKEALRRRGNTHSYYMSVGFINIMEQMIANDEFITRPEHVEDDF